MPYRVLNNEEMNWADTTTDHGSYHKMIEAACNAMEAQGYRLIAIEEADPESLNSPYYIFYTNP